MKRTALLLLALSISLNNAIVGQQRRRAAATPVAAATQCDKLAADPKDREARARGVPEDKLDAPAVITACEAETSREPVAARLNFQLARGYLKAGRVEDAIEKLLVAANQGHGGALAYLGDLYLDGVAGLEVDPVVAHGLYERAAQAGYAPAKTMLAQFEDFTRQMAAPDVAAKTKYLNPEIVDNILKGDLDAVPFGELYTKLYLVNMAENISEVCEDHFTKREISQLKLDAALKTVDMTPAAGLTTLMGALMGIAQMTQDPGGFVRQQAEAAIDEDQLPEDAMKDAFALTARHPCGSRELSQFSKNLVSFVHDEGAPRMSTNQLFSVCQREARPTGRYDTTNFCMCFTGAMTQTGVSRASRKGLSTDFWRTAQQMMAAKPGHYAMCNR